MLSAAVPTTCMPTSENLASTLFSSLFLRADDDIDTFYFEDLSDITKLAAVGDSYSAGIGAGDRLSGVDNWWCSRYDHAYPNLVNQDTRLGDKSKRTFQFHSCSGAVIKEVIEDQLPNVDSGQNAILLSAGGNDAELSNILNQCVFNWFVLNRNQASTVKLGKILEEEWAQNLDIDADVVSRGCQKQLETSQKIIRNPDFDKSLDTLLEATKKKLGNGGMIYYTGYAKFFATGTKECNDVSWAVWINLDDVRRIAMNGLVDEVNKKIEKAVERAGSQVQFINYDSYVERFKGRFCESGVDESSSESNTRPDLMFFELNSFDPLGSSPWKRSPGDEYKNGTFEYQLDGLARLAMEMEPEVELVHEDKIDGTAKPMEMAALEDEEIHTNDFISSVMPDGYLRVFHPQILLHRIIANMIVFQMQNHKLEVHGDQPRPELPETGGSCPTSSTKYVLKYKKSKGGKEVQGGTKLRILTVGDSITVGFRGSNHNGEGGYRNQLKEDLSENKVAYAGTESSGVSGDYFAAWSGKTIQYVSDHVGPSLKERPNLILLAAGTNDMNPNPKISQQGNDPKGAADRLGKLIDKMVKACPDATILVAMIINTCDTKQSDRTKEYQKLIPGVVKKRRENGKRVLAVDFTTFSTDLLDDCIHPTPKGYDEMGRYWYDFVTQIPKGWIKEPKGSDPNDGGSDENGGLDKNIPAPDWGELPIREKSKKEIAEVADWAMNLVNQLRHRECTMKPIWREVGKIALGGVGKSGDWKYHKKWVEADLKKWGSGNKVADGLGLDPRYVRLHDMNGDGKADYVWIHPKTGEIRCWINNLPDHWTPAGGNSNGVIGSGVGPAETIYIADMNGDGMADYLVVDPSKGSVRIWWNYGPDADWDNGWKFVPGGEIASGVPHANLKTLRFPDINGDGRADYVYIGEGGALKHHMNTGSPGGRDVVFHAKGGIATGASKDISKIVFADMNGDGRDDYLIWDDDGGLTGFLNQRTNNEGVPFYVNQGPAKTIADGIRKKPESILLADMDGDGKDDYVYVGEKGALSLWYNRGDIDDSMAIDGLRFADIDGDGVDDYIWLDPKTGSPTVYINKGPNKDDSLGWLWNPLNGGKPIASGAAPASQVTFGDIDGDGMDDYLTLDPKSGALRVYLNKGKDSDHEYGWRFQPIGETASGLGPGKNVRIADVDADGRDDYIYLHKNGRTTIYRNVYDNDADKWEPMPDQDASGVGQRPEEIQFPYLNGDHRADYVWTGLEYGTVHMWANNYDFDERWVDGGRNSDGVGTSGANVRYAMLVNSSRAAYVVVDPKTGALGAWLNGCSDD
ncbi:SGNH hydrolase-type esterase domain-containing protein [Fusarium venenatum]|uniref:SGNH hydrolase-type esterase domain-containing protein n=1 Tax=Fusarium venenatum TaxID=56646 RepID=UPI001D6AE45D|nr:SGNH hydrolase-type esterase domain-containing protein [Fusarium venenatum]